MYSTDIFAFFRESYGTNPDRVASAPARVNLIGEHTDYNGGEVLPMAIERRTYVAVRARSGETSSRVASLGRESLGSFDASQPSRSGQWWDYVSGVIGELRTCGSIVPQLDIAIVSDVPSGAGLSSSAALAVASTLAIGELLQLSMPLQSAADIAWRAETQFVGVPCGIMDQFASALAEEHAALHVWCDTMRTELVPCREHLLIFDTGVSRALRRSAFGERRGECARALSAIQLVDPGLTALAHASLDAIASSDLVDVLRARATHVVLETARVQESVAALSAGGTIPGELLTASHRSLRDLYECSSPELDWFVDHAVCYDGVRGARLTGAGWGGCAIATGEAEALRAMAGPLAADYARSFPHQSRSWLVQPSAGARIEG
jgi:galactokinase